LPNGPWALVSKRSSGAKFGNPTNVNHAGALGRARNSPNRPQHVGSDFTGIGPAWIRTAQLETWRASSVREPVGACAKNSVFAASAFIDVNFGVRCFQRAVVGSLSISGGAGARRRRHSRRSLRTEVRQAPSAAGQDSVVPSCGGAERSVSTSWTYLCRICVSIGPSISANG
jgi:hypothetical protein